MLELYQIIVDIEREKTIWDNPSHMAAEDLLTWGPNSPITASQELKNKANDLLHNGDMERISFVVAAQGNVLSVLVPDKRFLITDISDMFLRMTSVNRKAELVQVAGSNHDNIGVDLVYTPMYGSGWVRLFPKEKANSEIVNISIRVGSKEGAETIYICPEKYTVPNLERSECNVVRITLRDGIVEEITPVLVYSMANDVVPIGVVGRPLHIRDSVARILADVRDCQTEVQVLTHIAGMIEGFASK